MLHQIAGREAVGVAVDDLADRAAVHRLAELEWRDVAFHVVHPAAHVGVDRQPVVPDPDHARAERRELDVLQLEIVGGRHAGGRLFRCQARGILFPLLARRA